MKYDPIKELNREVARERRSWIRPFKPLMWPFLFCMSVFALMYLIVFFAKDIDVWAVNHQKLIAWTLVIVVPVLIVKKNLNRW